MKPHHVGNMYFYNISMVLHSYKNESGEGCYIKLRRSVNG